MNMGAMVERIAETNVQLAAWAGSRCRLWGYTVSHSTGLLRLGDWGMDASGLEIWCSGIRYLHVEDIGLDSCTLRATLEEDSGLVLLEEIGKRILITCSVVHTSLSTQRQMFDEMDGRRVLGNRFL